ncbi:unnamed protein product [Closterium sp. NIES-53]
MSKYAEEDTSESLPDRECGVGPTSTENTSPWLPPSPSAVRSPHAEVVRRKATSSKDMDEEWGDYPAHAEECAEGEGAITADECAESPSTLTNAWKGKAQCAGGFLRLLRGGGSAAREPGASANAPSARSSGDLFGFRRARGGRSMSWDKAPAEIRGDDKSARSAPAERGAAEGTREKAGRGGRTSPAGSGETRGSRAAGSGEQPRGSRAAGSGENRGSRAAGSGETRGSRAIRVPESPSNAEKGSFSTDEVSAAVGGHVDDDVSNFAGFYLPFEAGIGLGAEAYVSTSPKPIPAPKDKPPPSDAASLASAAFPFSPASPASSAALPPSASTTSSAAFPASSASPHSPAPAGRRMARSASANARSPNMSGYSGHILPPRRSLTAQRTSAHGDEISPWSAASPQFDASHYAATRSPHNAAHRAGNSIGSINIDGAATTSNADDNRSGNVNNEYRDDDNDDDEGAVMAQPMHRKGAKRGGSADLAPSAEAQLVAAAAEMLRGLGSGAQQTGGVGGAGNRGLHNVASPTGSAAAGRVSPSERQGSLQRGSLQRGSIQRSGARSSISNGSSANSSFKERSSFKNGGGGAGGGPGGASAIRRFSLEVQERLKQLQVSFDDSAAGADSDHASPFDEGAYNESAYNEGAESAYTEGADGERGRLNTAGQVEAAAAHAVSMNAHVLGNAPMLSPPPSPSAASHKPSPQSHSSFSPNAPPHPPASSFPFHARMPSPSASLHAPPTSHQQPSANPIPQPSSPHAPTSSPSSSPSSQHKPIPAIFSHPSPITTPQLHPSAPFALLASSPTDSPNCASPFPSASSPTCPPVSPSKPPRSPTSSPGLSPSSSRHFHRASSIRSPTHLSPSAFQEPLPSPNPPHSVSSCPDCTHRYPSLGLSHISPSFLPRHELPSSISGMGMGTGMGGGTGLGTGVGTGIEMGMVTGMVRGQDQRHQRSVSELTPNSSPTDLYPPSHHLIPPNIPNTATPGATAIATQRNNPQARGMLHTASPSFSPFHHLIPSPEESKVGTGTDQTLRAFTRSQSADCVEGSTALEETSVRVQAGNGRRFMRRNSVDGGSFGGPLGARMGYAAMAAHGRGARSPIKSCISPANVSGGAKLRKQVSFNKVVQVRRFTSCDASPEYY